MARADAKYTVTIFNSLGYAFSVSKYEHRCLKDSKTDGLPLTVKAHSSGKFSFVDDNGSCWNQPKWAKFSVKLDVAGNQEQELKFQWYHKNDTPWWTQITQLSTTGSLKLISATCAGSNCLKSSKYKGTGDMNITMQVGVADGASYEVVPVSLQLGKVQVTDGLGAVMPVDPVSERVALEYDKKYIIHFSKTQKQCVSNMGLISCPSSIDFKRDGDKIIFTCQQGNPRDPQCPWTMKAKTSYSAVAPIY
jgi:hypothetical protein